MGNSCVKKITAENQTYELFFLKKSFFGSDFE